jgi:hypothetical protein
MKNDKFVIECWLKLYNRLNDSTYAVVDWPDKDSSKQAIDAVCQDDSGSMLGVEHTLIQPFEGEKEDTAGLFMKTLAAFENHPDLLQPGFMIEVSQPVGAVQKGIDWSRVQGEQLGQLRNVLPTLPEGHHCVKMKGTNWSIDLALHRVGLDASDSGKLFVGRIWPGDPGPGLIIKALNDKVPKLSAFTSGKRILLLEKDAVAGTIERQFEQLPGDFSNLLCKIDEVWSANTSNLKTEGVVFTNQIWPDVRAFTCSLNMQTGKFWQKAG